MRALPFPRGVADPEGELGFFENLSGCVESVELGPGQRRWRSAVEGEPVLATREAVFALRLPLAIGLDAGTGKLLAEQDLPLELPPGAELSQVEVSAELLGSSLLLEWRSDGRYAGGAPAPDEVRSGFERRSHGTIEWDLAAGRAREMPGSVRQGADLQSWPYRRRGRWRETAWQCGDLVLRLALDDSAEAEQESVVLLATGERGPRPAGPAWPAPIEPTVTPDGCHLLVRETRQPAGPWQVVDLRAAREVARVPYREGSQFPAVLGGRLYFITGPRAGSPAALHAVDLASGEEVWELDLGPPPDHGAPPLPRSGSAP